MNPADVKWLQVENTTRCNAWCPGCDRNIDGYELRPGLVIEDLDTERFREILSEFPNLETIQFCGSFGDTMAALNVNEHIDLAKAHAKKLQIHTHGGIRNTDWWTELAIKLKDIDHDVWFALDGLKGTHEIYRQGTEFDKTIANARAFINAGGHATWQFIPWAHNEHQIKDCIKLSQEIGFKKFKLVFSVRKNFQGRHYQTGQPIEFRPWSRDKTTNKLEYIKVKTQVKQSDCHHLTQSSLYVNANGKLSHCCYFNFARMYDSCQDIEDITQELDQQPHTKCLNWCGSPATI